ncbi:MAG: hypothetical protein IKB55_00760, partial [Clostridia bacterium]|nr:hypothetical protein [Clostridia bacterium]
AIVRPISALRLGIAYHTPTFVGLTCDYRDSKKELVSTIKVGAAKYETVKIEKNQFVEAAEGTELFFETK